MEGILRKRITAESQSANFLGNDCTVPSFTPPPTLSTLPTSRKHGKRSLFDAFDIVEQDRLTENFCLCDVVHGSLARAGKVKSQTPKVDKQEKKKTPKGRAKKRILYNRRCVVVIILSANIVIADILRFFLASSTLRRSLAASVRCES